MTQVFTIAQSVNQSKAGEPACGRGPVGTGALCLFDGFFWKGAKENVKVFALSWISSCLLLLTPGLSPAKIQKVPIKGLSVAKWLNATADKHGYGDNDGSDKNPWNEHLLWSQSDLSLNPDLSFTNCLTLDRVV